MKKRNNVIKKMYSSGYSIEKIKEETGIKSSSTIYLALKKMGVKSSRKVKKVKHRCTFTVYKDASIKLNKVSNKSQYINTCILFYEKYKRKICQLPNK